MTYLTLEDAVALGLLDPRRHCFREESPTTSCDLCGEEAGSHSGCDCYPEV